LIVCWLWVLDDSDDKLVADALRDGEVGPQLGQPGHSLSGSNAVCTVVMAVGSNKIFRERVFLVRVARGANYAAYIDVLRIADEKPYQERH